MLPLVAATLLVQAPPASERTQVERPIQAYFRYHQTGDPQGLVEAFHPEALLQWAEQGQRKLLNQADWIKRAQDAKARNAGKSRPIVICRIVSLEVMGDAAVAKLTLDYPTFRFTDYLHLLRLESGWKIVDKVYHREEGPVKKP